MSPPDPLSDPLAPAPTLAPPSGVLTEPRVESFVFRFCAISGVAARPNTATDASSTLRIVMLRWLFSQPSDNAWGAGLFPGCGSGERSAISSNQPSAVSGLFSVSPASCGASKIRMDAPDPALRSRPSSPRTAPNQNWPGRDGGGALKAGG